MRITMEVLRTLKTDRAYDQAVPFLSMHPKELKSPYTRHAFTSMFMDKSQVARSALVPINGY